MRRVGSDWPGGGEGRGGFAGAEGRSGGGGATHVGFGFVHNGAHPGLGLPEPARRGAPGQREATDHRRRHASHFAPFGPPLPPAPWNASGPTNPTNFLFMKIE